MTLSRRSFFKRTTGALAAGLAAHWTTKQQALAVGKTAGLVPVKENAGLTGAEFTFSGKDRSVFRLIRVHCDIAEGTLVEYVDTRGTVPAR